VAPLVRLDRRIRPVLNDHCIVGKSPKGSRQVEHQALNTVARIWREYRVRPWRSETFKFSTDPQLAAKVHDVVGLYLHPPGRAVVLCVDEESQVQALERTQPVGPVRATASLLYSPDEAV
jgi:hypothetical protein